MKNALWFVVIFAGFMLVAASLDTSPEAARDRDLRAQQRAEIASCREAQNDKLAELSSRRMMRQYCDTLQSRYDQRWR